MNIYLCYSHLPFTTAAYYERAWEREHTVVYVGPPSGSRLGFAPNVDLAQLPNFGFLKPDLILWMEPTSHFFPRGLERVDCPTAAYLIDVHRHLKFREAHAPFFDYLFIAQRDYVPHFQRLGYPQVHWLPLACDPEIHRLERIAPCWDIGFVGSLNSPVRARRLELLSRQCNVNDYRVAYPKEAIGEIYRQSKIVFNSSIGGDLNMRVFEALASGALLLTDRIDNGQRDLFQDRIHLVEYGTDEELIELARYYLAHDDERQRIAQAGQQLVLSQHTYAQRAQSILDTVFTGAGPKRSAQVREGEASQARAQYARLYAYFGFLDAVFDELDWSWRQRQGFLRNLFWTLSALVRRLYRIVRHPRNRRRT